MENDIAEKLTRFDIKASVLFENDTVILKGVVFSFYKKQLAQEIIKKIVLNKEIRNQLLVQDSRLQRQ